ncbi:DDE superfamily endonuclease [Nonomuraea polychroma]|uniref:DDE superfamily endonuclease n=1 Tax=Nonomuraea polychroma TaxID=46176 RepID=A0A438MFC0_9ACTN|nr:transposase family protein [Nonomuraea polychroma]RVX44437.1 DDE superfamily endonuclease [Nonomuraea polychroma]
MLFYRAAVDLSRSMLNYVAGMIRRHRKAIGSLWRILNPGQQALLVLVYLRKGETYTDLAAGFGVSTCTTWRYVEETVALLSARSSKLGQALRKAKRNGLHYLVLDGTLIRTDRIKADRPYFSGKHRVHGMNVQVIAPPDGTILWTSGALPGKTHELSAARIWGILRALEKAGIITLADKAYQRAEDPVLTPYKGKDKPESQKQANRSHAKLRGPGERANAQLKSWKILRKQRCSPSKASHLCKAIAVLQNHRVAQTV